MGSKKADWYSNFDRLKIDETDGVDYRIWVTERKKSPVAIIAPHGGLIEPGTSEIAAAIAANIHSLYCFEGLRKRPHEELHITSTKFDEPECLDLINGCGIVVAVHGWARVRCAVDVGGRDNNLRDAISAGLEAAGFRSRVVTTGSHAAVSKCNVCNKGKRKKGVQLEIAKRLRDDLKSGKKSLNNFAESVRQAISSWQSS